VTESANILGIFNYPSYSHQIVFQKIVKDLSARGHSLTILTVNEINENYPNVTEIYMEGSYEKNDFNLAESKEKKFSVMKLFSIFYHITAQRTFHQLNNPEVQKLIKNENNQTFDLMLIEYIYQHPLIYLAEIFDCPVVAVSPLEVTNFMHTIMGNYVNFAINPEHIFEYEHGKLTLPQRIRSVTLHSLIFLLMVPSIAIGELTFKWYYFPNVKASFSDIEKNRIEFLLQNANPVLGATRPVTHNTIMLGNLHIEPPKELQGELRDFLDASKNGVIYVSFGTNVNTNYLNERSLSIFINTFKKLNYNVLWKLDGNHEQILNQSSNIYVSKWYPQADLLAHPNVKLFITHCGLMSLEESIDREVPMLAIPFLFDQYRNSFKVRDEEIGVHLEYETLTEESLFNGIMEATKSKYKENIKKFRTLMYDVPMQSREKAVWWIEYALRNKGRNKLKYIGTNVPFYQKCYLDVILVYVVLILLVKKLLSFLKSACKFTLKYKTE
jgi:UDP:flavonoid glycosyltransferase YjiC (YdhE family)